MYRSRDERVRDTAGGGLGLTIAKTIMGNEWGQGFLRYLQQGAVGVTAGVALQGNRGSPYSGATPSVARAALAFAFPLRGVNADGSVQGDALKTMMVKKLELTNFISQGRKRLQSMAANPGTTPAQLAAETEQFTLGANRKAAELQFLYDLTSR